MRSIYQPLINPADPDHERLWRPLLRERETIAGTAPWSATVDTEKTKTCIHFTKFQSPNVFSSKVRLEHEEMVR
jgi:hypothetical protein